MIAPVQRALQQMARRALRWVEIVEHLHDATGN